MKQATQECPRCLREVERLYFASHRKACAADPEFARAQQARNRQENEARASAQQREAREREQADMVQWEQEREQERAQREASEPVEVIPATSRWRFCHLERAGHQAHQRKPIRFVLFERCTDSGDGEDREFRAWSECHEAGAGVRWIFSKGHVEQLTLFLEDRGYHVDVPRHARVGGLWGPAFVLTLPVVEINGAEVRRLELVMSEAISWVPIP